MGEKIKGCGKPPVADLVSSFIGRRTVFCDGHPKWPLIPLYEVVEPCGFLTSLVNVPLSLCFIFYFIYLDSFGQILPTLAICGNSTQFDFQHKNETNSCNIKSCNILQ